eukprot:200589_1
MAKIHIKDWSAMNDEHAQITIKRIKSDIQNAVICGSTLTPPTNSAFGVTLEVEHDENLLIFHNNEVIKIDKNELMKIERINSKLNELDETSNGDVMRCLIELVQSIDGAGLVSGKVESLKCLWLRFKIAFKKHHKRQNDKQFAELYQLFLDVIYERRKMRVNRYIIDNLQRFGQIENMQCEIQHLKETALRHFNDIDNKMKICGAKCADCWYPCLLCRHHFDYCTWENGHDCRQADHSCKNPCFYCVEVEVDDPPPKCNAKCGHSGAHNCGAEDHVCGKPCSLIEFRGCEQTCTLQPEHTDNDPHAQCKCSSGFHGCPCSCALHPRCKEPCKESHN